MAVSLQNQWLSYFYLISFSCRKHKRAVGTERHLSHTQRTSKSHQKKANLLMGPFLYSEFVLIFCMWTFLFLIRFSRSLFFSLCNCIHAFIIVLNAFEAVYPHTGVALFSLIHSCTPQLWLFLICPIATVVQKKKNKTTHKGNCQNLQVEISEE